jgi:exodeoxyribonuclease-1
MAFAFYDLETTGTSPAFDQPLQFAAILTDDAFREIERINLRCRIAPHIIPSPWALAVTGVRPGQLLDPALPTLFEFTQDIGALIDRWSPATWTGFNSIRFDEEMLRQAFYQNLQPDVFATQFNGNTRFDVLTALYAVWHRHPDLFHWPIDASGRVRFKLDMIAPLNGFTAHNAHDALGDVEATIHIARLIAQRAPALWAELQGNRDKRHVQTRLEAFQPLALVERFGGGVPRATIGCFCGFSAGNPNQAAFFDLDAADPSDYLTADDATIFAAADASPKIIRTLAVNKSPGLLSVPAPTTVQAQRAEVIASAPDFRARVAQALAARFPEDTRHRRPRWRSRSSAGSTAMQTRPCLPNFSAWTGVAGKRSWPPSTMPACASLAAVWWRFTRPNCSRPKIGRGLKRGYASAGPRPIRRRPDG